MAKENFDAHIKTFKDVIDNSKKYLIPPYQRDYSWGEENWTQLWDDILSADIEHFLGIIVLQEEKKQIVVIDGQQRLTTILLIILMCLYVLQEKLKNLSSEQQKEKVIKQIDILSKKYIGKEEEDLKHYNKLKLNKQNDKCFASLCEKESIAKGKQSFKPDVKDPNSNALLKRAAKFFYTKLINHFDGSSTDDIISFINKNIVDKLIFTEITVNSSENAFILFESLNSRAMSLTSYDLLKNHLFSKCPKNRIQSMQSSLDEIAEKLKQDDLSRFIALAWNISHPKVPQHKIFRHISKEVNTGKKAFAYLRELESIAAIYVKLQEGTISQDKQINDIILRFKMFGSVRQYLMILLPLCMKYTNGLLKVIKALFNITIRYNYICNGQANRQEKIYHDIGQKIYNQKYSNTSDILKDLKSKEDICVTDEKLKSSFLEKDFTKENVDRFILCAIERQYIPEIALSEEDYTIEHISDKKYKNKYTNKIGNLTLLLSRENGALQDKTYLEKKEKYSKSTLNILKNITANVWDETAVQQRGEELADKFLKAFKI